MICISVGATPTCADTYLNAEGQAGYEFTCGWLRNPGTNGTTPNAAFLGKGFLGFCTHPTVFRLTVGFMARRLLRAGACSTSRVAIACAHCWLGRRCCRSSVRARARHTSMLLRIKGGYGDSRKR